MVLPDQFIDMTRRRNDTIFGDGAVAHVSMAQPVCPNVAEVLARAINEASLAQPINMHRCGTYICIEGPQCSTQAESQWYRSMGASVIGMTNMPEAKLAREARFKSPPVGGSKYNNSYVLHLASPDAVTIHRILTPRLFIDAPSLNRSEEILFRSLFSNPSDMPALEACNCEFVFTWHP